MPSNRTLAWVLAGGAALALGGVAIWLWRRRLAKQREQQLDVDAPSMPVERPAAASEPREREPSASTSDEPTIDPHDFQVEPMTFEPTEAANEPTPRAQIIPMDMLSDGGADTLVESLRRHWPARTLRPELELELGDEIAFVITDRDDDDKSTIDLRIAKVNAIDGDELDVKVTHRISLYPRRPLPQLEDYPVGGRVLLPRVVVLSVIKPEPVPLLVPTTRRKRYRVGPGDLIELRPDTIPELPPDSTWQPSRPDVTLRIVEQDASRSVVTLDGPAGEVNIALLAPTKHGHPRTVCSWKFETVERAA